MVTATTTATILVAEDDAAVRELLMLALEASGFNAIGVANTHDALQSLETTAIDLLLLDIGLGSENGADLLTAMRQRPEASSMPVIVLTGRADRETVNEILKMGVEGYVLKRQISRHDLMTRINQQVHQHKRRSAAKRSGRSPAAPDTPVDPMAWWSPSASRDAAESPAAAAAHSSPQSDDRPTRDAPAIEPAKPRPPCSEALQQLSPILTRDQTLAQVEKCAELKAFSPTVATLMSMTEDPECSLDQIARVVRRDQIITLKVLKIANSVVYSRGGSVDTVQKALTRIGVTQIRQAILNMAVIDNFHASSKNDRLNSELFWEHSIATGLIAAGITRLRKGEDRDIDRAFTIGLLHDVARMVFAENVGGMYGQVLDAASRFYLPLEQVESRMLLANHAELVEGLLKAWRFPERLIAPIAMHHLSLPDIRSRAPEIIDEVCTLALADRFAHALLLGSSGNECQYPTADFMQALGLEPDAMSFIKEQIPEQVVELKAAMMQSCTPAPALDYRQIVLKHMRRSIRPLYVSPSAAADGYRMFFERVTQPDRGQHPNVAILNLPNPSLREALFADLKKVENDRGIPGLPVIVISPLPNLKLDAGLLGGAKHEVLPSPFALAHLAAAVSRLIPADPGAIEQ